MAAIDCPECALPMRDDMERCPHCYRPGRYPNVAAAMRVEEKRQLDERYAEALAKADSLGQSAALEAYQQAILSQSCAVISRPFGEVQRLSYSEDEIYATFYQRVNAGLRLSSGQGWDKLRAIADTILFGDQNKQHVRFASLTLNGCGLPHYGDCSLILRTELIAHRASTFEDNSVVFMARHDVRALGDFELPAGFRSTWEDRAKLASAKVMEAMGLTTRPFSEEIQRSGPSGKDDVFIEIHIWGSLTIRSLAQVTILKWSGAVPSAVEVEVVRKKLEQYTIPFSAP